MTLALADLDDAALWQRCRLGSQAAWSVLVRRYQRLVYTIPRRAGLSEDAAADVFQFTFTRLFENLDRIEDASRLRAWLVTTAKRESLRLLQQARQFVDVKAAAAPDGDSEGANAIDPINTLEDPSPLPEALLAALQDQHALRNAVDRLDPRSRQFVELALLQEEPLPYHELAARLGIAEGSIGPTRARCIAKLRALLQGA